MSTRRNCTTALLVWPPVRIKATEWWGTYRNVFMGLRSWKMHVLRSGWTFWGGRHLCAARHDWHQCCSQRRRSRRRTEIWAVRRDVGKWWDGWLVWFTSSDGDRAWCRRWESAHIWPRTGWMRLWAALPDHRWESYRRFIWYMSGSQVLLRVLLPRRRVAKDHKLGCRAAFEHGPVNCGQVYYVTLCNEMVWPYVFTIILELVRPASSRRRLPEWVISIWAWWGVHWLYFIPRWFWALVHLVNVVCRIQHCTHDVYRYLFLLSIGCVPELHTRRLREQQCLDVGMVGVCWCLR